MSEFVAGDAGYGPLATADEDQFGPAFNEDGRNDVIAGGRVTLRFNADELAAVDARAGDEGRGRFVKRVVLEAAQGDPTGASTPGAETRSPVSPRASRKKVSAGPSVRVAGGRPPSPAAPPEARGVTPAAPIEGQIVLEQLGHVVAVRAGSASLALRALRLGQVTVDGVVVRDPELYVVADQVAVSDAG